MHTLVAVLREHAIAAIRTHESARRLMAKYVRVERGTSRYLGSDGYGAAFMTQLGVLLTAVLTQAAVVSRLLNPPGNQPADDAKRRSRHLRQALQFSGGVNVDRQARNNLEHIEHRLNLLISHAHTLSASSFSEGFVITREELAAGEQRTGGPTLFCWALIPDDMTLITVNADGSRHETKLPELVAQLSSLAKSCDHWLERARQPGTRQPYRD